MEMSHYTQTKGTHYKSMVKPALVNEFYSANSQLARTKLCSSNFIAINVNRADWNFESNRSLRKGTYSLKWKEANLLIAKTQLIGMISNDTILP